jgi:hypothetical protein
MYFTSAYPSYFFHIYEVDAKTMTVTMAQRDDSKIGGSKGSMHLIAERELIITGTDSDFESNSHFVWKVMMVFPAQTLCFEVDALKIEFVVMGEGSQFMVSVFEQYGSNKSSWNILSLDFDPLYDWKKYQILDTSEKIMDSQKSLALYVNNTFFIAAIFDHQISLINNDYGLRQEYFVKISNYNGSILKFFYYQHKFYIFVEHEEGFFIMIKDDFRVAVFSASYKITNLLLHHSNGMALYLNDTNEIVKDMYLNHLKNIDVVFRTKFDSYYHHQGSTNHYSGIKINKTVIYYDSSKGANPKYLEYLLKRTRQDFPPIFFDLEPIQISVFPDKSVSLFTNYTYTWRKDFIDIDYSIKKSQLGKDGSRVGRIKLDKNNLGNLWNDNKDQSIPNITISDFVDRSNSEVSFWFISKFTNMEFWKPFTIFSFSCEVNGCQYWPQGGRSWEKCWDDYSLTHNEWELISPVKTLLLWIVIVIIVSVFWVLMLLNKLPSAFYWSIINHYQSFLFILIIYDPYIGYLQTMLTNFLIAFVLAYLLIVFPPSLIIAIFFYPEKTTENQIFVIYIICLLVWVCTFYVSCVIIFFSRIKADLLPMIFKHNISLFVIASIISPIVVKIILLGVWLLMTCYNTFIWIKKVAQISVNGDSEEITVNKSEFRHLRYNSWALLHNVFFMVKRICQGIAFLIFYFSPNSIIYFNPLTPFNFIAMLIIELIWILYLYKVYPYKRVSLNRIEILNSLLLLPTFSIKFYYSINLLGDNVENYLNYIMPPYAYFLAALHFIVIKTCYKKKNGELIRREMFFNKTRIKRSRSLTILLSE